MGLDDIVGIELLRECIWLKRGCIRPTWGFRVAFGLSWRLEGKGRVNTAVAGLNSGLILYSDPVFNRRPFFNAF